MKLRGKALVVGAGSGRDIASAVLITERLRRQGIQSDLAGFLTPWALHTFDGALERPVNELKGDSAKFIPSEPPRQVSSYFEPELLDVWRRYSGGAGRIYLFSLQYGTEALHAGLRELADRNSYDFVAAVDFGGDILARRKHLPEVFTPIVDLTCLEILSRLEQDADLFVVSPGIDGEIGPETWIGIIEELEGKGIILQEYGILGGSQEYKRFLETKKIMDSVSHSYTASMLERIVEDPPESDLEESYRRLSRRGSDGWVQDYPVKLLRRFFSKVFRFDLKRIKSEWSDIDVSYKDILEAALMFRRLGAMGTEVDGAYTLIRASSGGPLSPPVDP